MAFVTLHTRLTGLLAEARTVRQMCGEAEAMLAAGNVSANAVVGLAQRLRAGLDGLVTPLADDTDLVDYAAAQFAGTPGWVSLDQQIAGLTMLASAVIAACRGCVPRDGNDRILKDTWNADGSVSVLALTPTDTADLRTALQTLYAAIPE